mgnify:CR=1 FL=1
MIFDRNFFAALAAATLVLAAASGAAHAEVPTSPAAKAAAPAVSHDAAAHDRAKSWQAILAKPSLAVAVAFDDSAAGGRLWRVAAKDGFLLASHSDDLGHSFSAPVRINPEPEAILGDGENRPKLLVRQGVLHVSWTRGLAGPMTGDIRYSRSVDGGKSFSAPLTVNDNRDVISHRFEALVADAQGRVALAWLDKRDLQTAQQAGQPYTGAAVYVAESRDGGKTFAANRKLADHSCECCRVALAQDADGMPVALWRHVFASPDHTQIRDFAIARFDDAACAVPSRASEDGWQLNGCPHHGGDLAIDAQGSRHLAWFTGAAGKAGLWYRRIDGAQARPAMSFGDAERQPGHAAIFVHGDSVHLAWQEYDGKALRIRVMSSHDRGERWGQPATQASTAHGADYPQLLGGRGKVWLAWNSADEGLRLWPLDAP